MKKLLLISLILFMVLPQLKAINMMGGELTWNCVGKDSFLVTLTKYRDCSSVNFSTYGNVVIKCKSTGMILTSTNIMSSAITDITPTCASSCTRCQSGSCSFSYGIEQYKYQGIIYLGSSIPSACCELEMYHMNCCRRTSDVLLASSYYYCIEATLNRCLSPCDNAPTFTQPPIMIACLGQGFVFNYGAVDIDTAASGSLIDSISYELTAPLTSLNSAATYNGSYSYRKPLYFWGFPNEKLPYPRGFHLDSLTGDLSFLPMKIENSVMVLTVKEYRYDSAKKKRVLIGSVNREMQLIVLSCPSNSIPVLGGQNYYKEICLGDTLNLSISSSDNDSQDTVYISWDSTINDAVWTDNNGKVKHPQANLYWVPGEKDISSVPHTFTVSVEDNACPIPGRSNKLFRIVVKPKMELDVDAFDLDCGEASFTDKVKTSGASWLWNIQGASFTGSKVQHKFKSFGSYPYSLTKTDGGCTFTYYDTIYIDTFIKLDKIPEQKACYGDTLNLEIKYEYDNGTVWGIWNGSVGAQHKSYYIDQDMKIVYGCLDSVSGCSAYDSVDIDMLKPARINLGSDVRLCPGDSQIINPKIVKQDITLGVTYWSYLQKGKTDTVSKYVVSDSGTYICFFKDTFGCIGLDTLNVKISPLVQAFATDQSVCLGDTAYFEADKTGSKSANVQYHWYDNQGQIGSGEKISVSPSLTTSYLLFIKESIDGVECSDSIRVTANILPNPVIITYATDEPCVSGLNSGMLHLNNYISTTPANTLKEWTYRPDSSLVSSDVFDHYSAGVGTYWIYVQVTNPLNGCVSYDSVQLNINPLPLVDAGTDDTLCSAGGLKELWGYPDVPSGYWSNYGSHKGIEGDTNRWVFNPQASGITDGKASGIVYSYVDFNGCQNFDTAFIVVFENPVVDAGLYDTFCAYDIEESLNGIPSNGFWSGSGVVDESFNPYLAGRGTHELIYEVWNDKCVGRDTAFIEVISTPIASFAPLTKTQGIDYAVRFYDLSYGSGSGGIKSLEWSFGDGDSSDEINPLHVYDTSGDYKVSLLVLGENGCMDELQKVIHVEKGWVGLEEEKGRYDVLIYPNPFEDKIYVKSSVPMQEIEVYDLLGECIGVHRDLNVIEKEIELITNNSGIFMLKIYFKDQGSDSYLIMKK